MDSQTYLRACIFCTIQQCVFIQAKWSTLFDCPLLKSGALGLRMLIRFLRQITKPRTIRGYGPLQLDITRLDWVANRRHIAGSKLTFRSAFLMWSTRLHYSSQP
jgi:hypothetical protein